MPLWTTCTDCGMAYAVNESSTEACGQCLVCAAAWDAYRGGGELCMYNTATLVGCVGEAGTATVEKRNGTRMCGFQLLLSNTRRDGQHYRTLLDIECYGSVITQAEQLDPGVIVLVEGKIAPRRGTTGDSSLAIVARQIQRLPAEAVALLDARELPNAAP